MSNNRKWIFGSQLKAVADQNVAGHGQQTDNVRHIAPHINCSCSAPMVCSATVRDDDAE